jgi:hypothetical protein
MENQLDQIRKIRAIIKAPILLIKKILAEYPSDSIEQIVSRLRQHGFNVKNTIQEIRLSPRLHCHAKNQTGLYLASFYFIDDFAMRSPDTINFLNALMVKFETSGNSLEQFKLLCDEGSLELQNLLRSNIKVPFAEYISYGAGDITLHAFKPYSSNISSRLSVILSTKVPSDLLNKAHIQNLSYSPLSLTGKWNQYEKQYFNIILEPDTLLKQMYSNLVSETIEQFILDIDKISDEQIVIIEKEIMSGIFRTQISVERRALLHAPFILDETTCLGQLATKLNVQPRQFILVFCLR